eukprot:GHVS01095300.1.p1 GENE.GHVS01095300.1~~GHVS01095300.1.p1  ORF type:complete len:487 (+),score=87.32 GHVS01095300.1:106-1566(+)
MYTYGMCACVQTDGQLSWTEADTTGSPRPSARCMHSTSVCKDYLVIFGGATDAQLTQTTNDLFVLNLTGMEWLKAEQIGEIPSPRCGHKTAYVPATDNILMFGGADDDGAVFSLNCSNIPHLTWSRVEIANTPPFARTFHSLDIIGDRLFVFAGATLTGDGAADLYLYQLNKGKWSRPLFDGQINVRGHASAVLHDKLIVFGGARERSDQQRDKLDEEGGLMASHQRVSKKMFFLNVLEIREGSGDGDFKFKLVTVGDSGVGKSCLLTRFVQDVYSDFHVSTIGLDFKSVVTMLKGKLVTLQLWDTAGQERFSGVTGNYYRNADGFVLVFDATRRESFEHIENWMKQIEEHHECGGSTVRLLIGNKSDLKGEVVVTEAEAKALADKIGALYVATSAKTATNVDAAFLSAANQLVEIRRKLAAANRKATSLSGGGGGQSIEGRVSLGAGGGGGGRDVSGGGCGGGCGGRRREEVVPERSSSGAGRRR